MNYDDNNEFSYDENYCLQYYTVQDFIREYPEDYIAQLVTFGLDISEDEHEL